MAELDRRTALAAGLALTLSPSAAPAADRRWEGRADVPWPVQEVYGTVLGEEIVIAGGMAPTTRINPLDRTGVYDPAADRWREGPKLPFPRHHPALATAGGKAYAFGGYRVTEVGGWTAIPDALRLDGEAWTPIAPMPRLQCETVALGLGDRIHIVSGRAPKGEANVDWRDQGDIDLHQVFDTRAGRWSSARPCPEARNSAAGAVIDGLLYLAGGRRVGEGNSARLDRYDPTADRWETLAPMPKAAGGLAAAAAGDKLFVFGGEGGPGMIAECWSYDPKADRWTAEPPMRTPRHGLAGAAVSGVVYAIGGGVKESGAQVSAVNEALVPA
jgi:N-acetylneuraminic acid mutarotase